MRRFFVKNILFVIAVNVLVKPIWVFFIDRTVQNTVPGGSYGTYQALLSLSIIFQTVLDFGISSYNSRMISADPKRLPELFPAMLSARLVLMVAYMLIAFMWAYAFGYRGWELKLLVGVLLIQSLNALLSFIRSNVAALHRFKTDGVLSIIDRLLAIVICGFLLTWPVTAKHFKIEWFVITQIVCYLIAAVIGYFILVRIGKVKLSLTFHPKEVVKIAKQSAPYALLIFLMSIYNRADMMMIERLCADGKDQAGIFAAGFRLLDMGNILGLMFATMLLPMFGRMLAQDNDVQPIIRLCVNILIPFAFIVAVSSALFSSEIMYLLYKKNPLYPSHALSYEVVFAILMASFPAWCLMYIYSTLLTSNGSLATLNKIAFVGVVINLTLNFVLIPQYKAVGGAITSFITQTVLAVVFTIYAARIIKLRVNMKWVLAHLGYLVVISALAYGVSMVLRQQDWKLQLAVFGACSFALMFVFRFISVGAIRQVAKMR